MIQLMSRDQTHVLRGLHDDQGRAPVPPGMSEQHPKQSISRTEWQMLDRALEHRQLLTEAKFSSATARCPPQISAQERSATRSASSMSDHSRDRLENRPAADDLGFGEYTGGIRSNPLDSTRVMETFWTRPRSTGRAVVERTGGVDQPAERVCHLFSSSAVHPISNRPFARFASQRSADDWV